MLIFAEGYHADQPRSIVIWDADPTETRIPIRHNGRDFGFLPPNTEAVVPDFIAEQLADSSYAVRNLGAPQADQPAEEAPAPAHEGDSNGQDETQADQPAENSPGASAP
jgi:hypothetical protein